MFNVFARDSREETLTLMLTLCLLFLMEDRAREA